MNKTTAIKQVTEAIFNWVADIFGICPEDYDFEPSEKIECKEIITNFLSNPINDNFTRRTIFSVATIRFGADLINRVSPDVCSDLISDINEIHKEFSPQTDQPKVHKEFSPQTDQPKVETKNVKAKIKTIGKKVLIRKVARKIVNQSQNVVVDWLIGPDALNDPTLRTKIAAFLSTDFGRALFAAGIGLTLDLLPTEKLPFGQDITGVLSELSEELKVQATDQATIPLENAAMLLLPMFKENIMPLLVSGDTKKLTQ